MKILSGRRARPRRTLFYGQHGIGKSSWAAGSPSPFFIQCEEGLDDIGPARTDLQTSVQEVEDSLAYLSEAPHDFKTVVIDTLDWYEKLIWQLVAKNNKVSSIDEIPFFRGYGYCLPFWEQFLRCLDFLLKTRGMNVILLAHAKIQRFQDPKSDGYDRYEPALHKKVCATLQEWCDEVLFGGVDVAVITKEAGFGKERSRAVDTNQRVVFTCEMPTHLAKRRIPMDDKIEMTWAAYQQFIDTAYSSIGDIEGIVRNGSSKQDV